MRNSEEKIRKNDFQYFFYKCIFAVVFHDFLHICIYILVTIIDI